MGTCWNCLIKTVLTSTHNLCFEQKYEKYQIFLSENFQFLVAKFSICLNRRVFVMGLEINEYKGGWLYLTDSFNVFKWDLFRRHTKILKCVAKNRLVG